MQIGLTLYQKAQSVSCLSPTSITPTFPVPHPTFSKLLILWAHWYVQIPAFPLALQNTGLSWHVSHRPLHCTAQATTGQLLNASRTCEHPAATQGHFPIVICASYVLQCNTLHGVAATEQLM